MKRYPAPPGHDEVCINRPIMKTPHNEMVVWPHGLHTLQDVSCPDSRVYFPAVTLVCTDEALFLQIADGNQVAFQQLFRRYYTALYRFSRGILGNDVQAEDVVQDVFEKIWNKRESIEIVTSVKAYLYMAVKNYSLNQLKLQQRTTGVDTGVLENNILFAENMEAQIEAASLHKRVTEAIESLPPKCRRIFKMSRLEHKSHKEIAGSLDVSVKTVENHIGKALQVLKAQIHIAS